MSFLVDQLGSLSVASGLVTFLTVQTSGEMFMQRVCEETIRIDNDNQPSSNLQECIRQFHVYAL